MKIRKDNVTPGAGQYRAHRLYPEMGKCEMCDAPAVDIHHKDGDRTNNKRSNMMFLCRYHHMKIDGRLELLIKNNKNRPSVKTLKPCVNCGMFYFPLRRGRCHVCNEYFRRNGVDRQKVVLADGSILQRCPSCDQWFELNTRHKKYCVTCAKEILRKRHVDTERRRRKTAQCGGRCHSLEHGIKEQIRGLE